MEKALSTFLLPFSEGFVAEISDFVQICDFREPLRFADDADALNELVADCLVEFFFQCFGGFVEYIALAEPYRFVGLRLKLGEELARYARSLGEVGFRAVLVGLEEADGDDIVLEFGGLLPVGSNYDAKEEVATACVVDDDCQVACAFFSRYDAVWGYKASVTRLWSVNLERDCVKLFVLVQCILSMQGAVLRNTSQRRRHSRLVTVLFLPVFAIVWILGWTLYWFGNRKDNAQLQPVAKPKGDLVQLFSANTVKPEEDGEEENEEALIASVLD